MTPRKCLLSLLVLFLVVGLDESVAFGQSAQAGSKSQSSHASAPHYQWKNVKIVAGGFITGIIPHPTIPHVLYVRTDIGGAYRYDPLFKKFTPLNDIFNQNDWNLTGTESIAVDPVEPWRLYLAKGTYTQSWAGNGAILRSTNFGLSFQRTDLPIKLGANEAGRYSGERLAVDPQHHNVLYLGTRNNGLWKSTDFGANWSQVSTFPVTGPTSGVGVIFVLFQPTSTKPKQETIYVGVSDPNTGLYSSTDGGTTWTSFNTPGGGPRTIAISSDGLHWVVAPNSGAPSYSTDNGATWTPSSGAPGSSPVVSDRANPLKFYSFDWNTGTAFVSTNGGASFAPAATGLPGGNLYTSVAAEGDLWLATSSGLFHSTDSGASFTNVGTVQQAFNLGFGKPAPWSKFPALYLSGQVNNVLGIFRSTDAGATWVRINDDHHQWGAVFPLTGDPRIFGRVYIGTNGRGIIYGDSDDDH